MNNPRIDRQDGLEAGVGLIGAPPGNSVFVKVCGHVEAHVEMVDYGADLTHSNVLNFWGKG